MSGETVLERPDEARIRDELEKLVVHDLHGPFGDEEEEFKERPTDRYILGRLAPEGETIEPDLMDDGADTDGADVGEDEAEPSVLTTASLMPSALGCTVFVDGDTAELKVTGHWARYERVDGPEGGEGGAGATGGRVWSRVPDSGVVRPALREGRLGPERMPSDEHVVVRGRARRHDVTTSRRRVAGLGLPGQPHPQAADVKHSKGETMTTSEPLTARIVALARENMPLPWLTTAVGVAWRLPLFDEPV